MLCYDDKNHDDLSLTVGGRRGLNPVLPEVMQSSANVSPTDELRS
jgi:hypothetical protein